MTAELVANRRLLLIGLMGSGKSSVGRLVADEWSTTYVDNDAQIALLAGTSTVDLARRGGELHAWESAYARHLATLPSPLVAGLPASCADRGAELAALGCRHDIVYLRCDVDTLVTRVSADSPRPWLDDDPRPFLQAAFARRDPVLVAAAHHVIEAAVALSTVVAGVLALYPRGAQRSAGSAVRIIGG